MTNHEAMAAAREATVGDECDLVSEPCTHEGTRGTQHLAHSRAAARALAADHDHIAGANASVQDRLCRALLAFKHPRATLEALALLAGDLGDRSFGREVAVEHHEVAVLLQR